MTRVSAVMIIMIVAFAGRAYAQSAEAEILFRDGRNLIKAGKIAEGCTKLAASERLEPSVGTLLNLGDCNEKLGHYASAWAAFTQASAMAKRAGNDDKRRAEAQKRAAVLEGRLSNLVIQVDQPVAGLVVKRDNEVVDAAAWGVAVPVDPEQYDITAEAPGFKPYRTKVVLDGKLRRRVVRIPKLELQPSSPAIQSLAQKPLPAPPPTVVMTAPQPVQPPTETRRVTFSTPIRRSRTWSATREVAIGIGVLGVAALGGGIHYASRADDLQRKSDARCPTTTCNDSVGLQLSSDAQDAALRANIGFAAAGGAAAIATLMWIVGKPSDQIIVSPTASEHQAGVALSGRF